MRPLKTWAIAIGVSAALAAGPVLAQSGEDREINVLVADPTTLVSAFNTALPLGMISTKMLEGLVSYDLNMNPQPSLATDWSVSEDGLTYTFNLREGVTWHDGEPFTSRDVAFSAMEVWREFHPRGRSIYAFLEEVETPDDLTAIFRLSSPSPVLLSAMHAYESQILPAHIYEGTDILENPANAAPIGTGPFRFVEWQRGQYVILQRNDDYWAEGQPWLERIIFRVIGDPSARAAALESGTVDIGYFSPVSLSEAERLNALPNIDVIGTGYEYATPMFFMELNLRHEPLNDRVVRQAMSYAIDRDFIIDNIFLGFARPSTGPIQTSSRFYTPDTMQYPYNPDLANQMLDEAGYERGTDGWRFTITHDPVPQGDEHRQTAEYIKQAFADIGINVEIRNQDLAGQINRLATWEFDMSSNPLFAMFDPALGVTRLFWSENIREGVPYTNISGFSHPEVDAAIVAQGSEPDFDARREHFVTLQQIVQEEVPIIYLLEVEYLTVANTRVQNHTVDGAAPFSNFANVTLE